MQYHKISIKFILLENYDFKFTFSICTTNPICYTVQVNTVQVGVVVCVIFGIRQPSSPLPQPSVPNLPTWPTDIPGNIYTCCTVPW